MIRILIADDHLVVREGLQLILSMEEDMAVVGEAAYLRLLTLVSEMKIIYLVGGIELTGMSPALYIVRES